MAEIRNDRPLVTSVLDRLLDDEPERRQELPKARNQVLRELKESVRRDLQNLLNTRWRCSSWPPDLDELEQSLVNYGLPDFTGANLAATRPDDFRQIVEAAIRRAESRFKTVKVELLRHDDQIDRTLRFRINVLLYAQPAPEPLVFDSQLEPVNCTFKVKSDPR
jgi:type VI secretion system protein ImpF